MAPALSSGQFVLTFAMWWVMMVAMMLPSAAPTILLYGQAASNSANPVRPETESFLAGYLLIWGMFSLLAALLQLLLSQFTLLAHPRMASGSGLLSSAILIGAGLYQLSPLKQACLHQCQRPFPFFFTHWATTPAGVFRLGLMQGGYCLGCCWALMLVMLATGTMNVVWMAILGAVMTIEKMTATPRFAKAVGATLIAFGAVFVVSTLSGVWLD